MPLPIRARFLLSVGLTIAALVFSACTSNKTGPEDPQPGTIALTLGQSSGTIPQGGTTAVAVTLTRGGGFTGAVTFTAQGVPTGVTAGINNQATTGTTTTANVAIVVAANAAPGTYTITVRGSGSGVTDATATFTLTITQVTAPNFSLAMAPATMSLPPSGNASGTVTVTRAGGFDGAVQFALTGAPAQVAAAFSPTSTTGNSTEITLYVGVGVAPGTYPLFVTGTATGMTEKVAPLTLTVTAGGSFSLGVSSSATLPQGGNTTVAITLSRIGGFVDPVTLSAIDGPAGLTASFDPSPTTGSASTLTLTASAGLAPGTYPINIRAVSGAIEATNTLQVTVTAASVGNVSLSFAACSPSERPIWFAARDGNGPWTRVTPVGQSYSFDVDASRGSYAYVVSPDADAYAITVQTYTRTELTSMPLVVCAAKPTKSHSANVVGFGLLDATRVSLGGSTVFPSLGSPDVVFQGVADGPNDLVGWRINTFDTGTGFLRRDVNLPDGASLGTIELSGPESHAPVSAPLTISNPGGGTTTVSMAYGTGAACRVAPLYTLFGGNFYGNMYGFPAAAQRPTDFHIVSVAATSGAESRFSQLSLHTLAARTLTLGPALTVPTVSALGGPYKRLQATAFISLEYNSSVSLMYSNAVAPMGGGQVSVAFPLRAVNISASAGAVPAPTPAVNGISGYWALLEMPDFTGVAGWNPTWAPAVGGLSQWSLSAAGNNLTESLCQEGARISTVIRTGTN